MYSTSILNDKLKSFGYYKNKLPLYLRNSNGFIEHFKIWYDLLTNDDMGVIEYADTLLYALNIFDDKYLEFIADFCAEVFFNNQAIQSVTVDNETTDTVVYDSQSFNAGYGTQCDILDKIGSWFGVSRNFSVKYLAKSTDSEPTTYDLSLTNDEFLMLIKCRIVRNHFNGSYEQMKAFYELVGLYTYVATIPDKDARALIYLIETSERVYSDNIKHMFKAGELLISSMGVQYDYTVTSTDNALRWNGLGYSEVWDNGAWV